MSLGEMTVVNDEDVEVMLAVTRLAYATSDISRDISATRRRKGGRGMRKMTKKVSRGMQDRVLIRACRSMEGFVCGGPNETVDTLAYRIEERVCEGMSWIMMFFLRHLVSWAVSFIIDWMTRELEADVDYN